MVRHITRTYSKILSALTEQIFPRVVTYATHPLTIAATILLLVPLILDASNTSLALVLGNYTNVVSASVSSIVLLQTVHHVAHTRAMHQEHREEIAKLHKKIDAVIKNQSQQITAQKVSAPNDQPHASTTTGSSTSRRRSRAASNTGSRNTAST